MDAAYGIAGVARQVPASLTGRMKIDLEAWRLAKAIIAAAKP
jgi:hypothetical protein